MAKQKEPKIIQPGDIAKTGSEFSEQTALFCWVALPETRKAYPDAIKLYANYNNAGKGDAIRGAMAKQSGTRPGVADTFLPVARHGMHGLYIELKVNPNHPANQRTSGKTGKALKAKSGGLTEDQIKFRDQVHADGYGWALAEGWEAAVAIIKRYLK